MSEQDGLEHERRITALETVQDNVVSVLKEVRDKLESLQMNSHKMGQITTLLESLNGRFTTELASHQAELKLCVAETRLALEKIRAEKAESDLTYAKDKALLTGQIQGVKLVWGVMSLLFGALVSIVLWTFQTKIEELSHARNIAMGNSMELRELNGKVDQLGKDFTELVKQLLKESRDGTSK